MVAFPVPQLFGLEQFQKFSFCTCSTTMKQKTSDLWRRGGGRSCNPIGAWGAGTHLSSHLSFAITLLGKLQEKQQLLLQVYLCSVCVCVCAHFSCVLQKSVARDSLSTTVRTLDRGYEMQGTFSFFLRSKLQQRTL